MLWPAEDSPAVATGTSLPFFFFSVSRNWPKSLNGAFGFAEIDGAPVPHGVYEQLLRSYDEGVAEGAVLDWSAVFLTAVRNIDPATAGFGYVAFAVTMTVGRLTGDRVVHRLGATRVVLFGSLLAASGFLLAILAPSWMLSIIGFGLVGAGASNVVPVMFSAAGRQHVMPTHLAVAAITTMGYAGVLLGPALLGFVAKATTLSFALGLLAALLVAVAMTARVVTR